jgi:hypothetical protein
VGVKREFISVENLSIGLGNQPFGYIMEEWLFVSNNRFKTRIRWQLGYQLGVHSLGMGSISKKSPF